jgi:hypothetical protein
VTRHYATACKAYQIASIVESMERHCGDFKIHILAWDWDPCRGRHPNTVMTGRNAFLARHPECASLPGPPRTTNETVCAVRWEFILDVMEDTGQPVTLIDGDQFFFGSPEPAFAEIWDARCAVSPHGFAPASAGLPGVTMETHRRYGLYNGGWSYWADRRAAQRMAELARECSRATDHHWPGGRVTWGDQGALELIQEEFGAHIIRTPAVNLAPWNVHRHTLKKREGVVYVDGRPLISYHFQSLRPGQLADPHYAITPEQARLIYAPYLSALERTHV